jgi:hypothetical protein
MATLGDLKTRVVTETIRDDLLDDLADQLTLAISRAIEFYQGERFWFNTGAVSATATGSVLAMPATMRVVDDIALAGGCLLSKFPLRDLLGAQCSGVPSKWAEYAGGFYLWPTPGSSTDLTLYGVQYIEPPADDDDETVWTNEAYDLIAAHTRFILYRDIFFDKARAELAKAAIDEAVGRLKQETARRADTPLRMPAGMPIGCNRFC